MQRMALSFFVILGGAVISTAIALNVLGLETITTRDLTGLIILAAVSSLGFLFLYSKKLLTKRQLVLRYTFGFVYAVVIIFAFASHLGWIGVGTAAIFGTAAHFVVFIAFVVFIFAALFMIILRVSVLENNALIDELTGISNRRSFEIAAKHALKADAANKHGFAVILFDLDHFKRVNDEHGHAVGDEVLKITADRARHVLKTGMMLARYGGEEFILMVTGTDSKSAENIAARIHKNIESTPFSLDSIQIAVTASFGVAMRTARSQNLTEIVHNADKALYQAKEAGRNMVVVFSDDE